MRHLVWTVVACVCFVNCVEPFAPAPSASAREQAPPEIRFRTDGGARKAAPISLTASDGTGLELVSLEARTVIEDPLAFTELHLWFRNPEKRRREGRFEINLPPTAAISRFAMKMGEHFTEGEVVERQKARVAYEEALHGRRDPALLEKKSGNQFRARVFPIEAEEVKQLIVSYSEQLIDVRRPYRLYLAGLPRLGELRVEVSVVEAESGERGTALERAKGAVRQATLVKQRFTPPGDVEVRTGLRLPQIAARHGDLVVARVAPEIAAKPSPLNRLTVLFDTSFSSADGFRSRVSRLSKVIAALDGAGKGELPLRVVAFDQEIETIFEGRTGDFSRQSEERLNARMALGATDLSAALKWVSENGDGSDRILLFSDGIATAGEDERSQLRAAVVALGAVGVERLDAVVDGSALDEELLRALVGAGLKQNGILLRADAKRDEIARRLTRDTGVTVKAEVPGAKWVWPHTLAGVQPGDQRLVFARLEKGVSVTVRLNGERPVRLQVRPVQGELLEREWARAKIAYLEQKSAALPVSDRDAARRIRDKMVSLSIENRVLIDETALVVLETEWDYRRFGFDRRALADILVVENGELATVQGAQRAKDRLFHEPWLEEEAERGRGRSGTVAGATRPGSEGAGTPIRRFGVKGPSEGEEAFMARKSSSSSGVVARAPGSWQTPSSPFGRDSALGRDPMSALGALTGDSIGVSLGLGGLGMRGTGRGSGGRGEGTVGRMELDASAGAAGEVAPGRAAESGTVGSPGRGRGSAGDAFALRRRASRVPRVRPARVDVRGSLSKEVIRRVIRRHLNEVRYCYELELIQRPDVRGRVAVKFMIAPTGKVRSAAVVGDNLGSYRMERCLLEAVQRWQFPSVPDGGFAVITYPFLFEPRTDATAEPRRLSATAAARPQAGSTAPRTPAAPRESDAGNPRLPVWLSEWKKRPPTELEDYLEGRIVRIKRLIDEGEADKALEEARAWIAKAPGEVMALIGLGEAAEATKELRLAARAYGSLVDRFPSRADMRRAAGQRLEKLGAVGNALAIDTFERAVAQRPDHPSSHRLLAFALLRDDRPEQAFDALVKGYRHSYPGGRFEGVRDILAQDLGIVAAVWRHRRPEHEKRIGQGLARLGVSAANKASLRMILYWESDASDIDLHVYDKRREHAFYSQRTLSTGGKLLADVTNGYGPECFAIQGRGRGFPYTLFAHYYSQGPMGHSMGKLQIVAHDGAGRVAFEERPFAVMKNDAQVPLGRLERSLL